ncbi:F-box domain-containing protein [Mycena indigotica]|uniref:F-box domain-containing protein n=1 Tax=Mycena indigotica TaxID=2126181 RepID=A0A8H6WEX7_9AGAR|nr:F-box domain-containing protein [Mycena indigotica]KAF7316169.1 F-box domain-containing protein [Mycena indigotica]
MSTFTEHLGTNYTPEDDEIDVIKSYIDRVSPALRNAESEIAEMQKAMDALVAQRDTIRGDIDAHKSLITPIRRLPLDLLERIFIECLPEERNCVMSATEPPLLLGRVCSSWRSLAYETPRLWSRLHVYIPNNNVSFSRFTHVPDSPSPRLKKIQEQRMAVVNWWLSNSGNCPLSISLYLPGGGSIADILDQLREFSMRWEHISIRTNSDVLKCLVTMTREEVPLLRSFAVFERSTARTDDMAAFMQLMQQAGNAPNNAFPMPANPIPNANAALANPNPNANPIPNANAPANPAAAPLFMGMQPQVALGNLMNFHFAIPAPAPAPATNQPNPPALNPPPANQPALNLPIINNVPAPNPPATNQPALGQPALNQPAPNQPAPNQPILNPPTANPPLPNPPIGHHPAPPNLHLGFPQPWNTIFGVPGQPPPGPTEPEPEPPLWETAAILTAPILSSLSLTSAAFNLFELPIQWAQMTELNLEKQGLPGVGSVTSREVVRLLGRCQNLVTLRVTVQDLFVPTAVDIEGRVLQEKLETFHLSYSTGYNGTTPPQRSPFRLIGSHLHLPGLLHFHLDGSSGGIDMTNEFFAQNFLTLAPALKSVHIGVWMFSEAELIGLISNLPPTLRILCFPAGHGPGPFEVGAPIGDGILTALLPIEDVMPLPELHTLEIHARAGFSESFLLQFIEQRLSSLQKVLVHFQRYNPRSWGVNPPQQQPERKKMTSEEAARLKALVKGAEKGLKLDLKYPDKHPRVSMSPWMGLGQDERERDSLFFFD